ncbi:hypothetical protein [Streptomyces sp. NBC_00872]|uniref:hypothetical protein n=1 Tax=Streptomyces sp. NBC_00872 TaxID=2903686 RepID=UPI0038689ED6|nr:hypothetical protein OG214_07150 [Streptomyces sp. NBC_00872]
MQMNGTAELITVGKYRQHGATTDRQGVPSARSGTGLSARSGTGPTAAAPRTRRR